MLSSFWTSQISHLPVSCLLFALAAALTWISDAETNCKLQRKPSHWTSNRLIWKGSIAVLYSPFPSQRYNLSIIDGQALTGAALSPANTHWNGRWKMGARGYQGTLFPLPTPTTIPVSVGSTDWYGEQSSRNPPNLYGRKIPRVSHNVVTSFPGLPP